MTIWTRSRPRATLDGETRSCTDLTAVGAWCYSKDSTTELMCAAYKLGDGPTRLWHMAHPHAMIGESDPPEDLFRWILDGGLVEAHNAFFEKCWWRHVAVPRLGWPDIPDEQWSCSAAKASSCGLPRDLAGACRAMDLGVQKDMAGRRNMLKLSKPRKPRKDERERMKEEGVDPASVVLWHEDEEDLVYNWKYCSQDVDAEHALSEILPDLSAEERQVWLMDQRLNWRGVLCDLRFAESAIHVAKEEQAELNERLAKRTGGLVATQRDRIKSWVAERGLHLDNMQADTIAEVVERPGVSAEIIDVLKLYSAAGQAASKKYKRVVDMADPFDRRVRDVMRYHGAERTGRWTGQGMQVHNFARGSIKDMEFAVSLIRERDRRWIKFLQGDVLDWLGQSARGVVVAPFGRSLSVADYAAIEARVLFWLVEDEEALDIFRSGRDIYCEMATEIYGYPVNKRDHFVERFMGKQSILGLGYGMGGPKFVATCAKFDQVVTNRFATRVVRLYRKKFDRVPQFWKNIEFAAIETVRTGEPHRVNRYVGFEMAPYGDFLLMRLPSGRALHYLKPAIEPQVTFFFKGMDPQNEADEPSTVLVSMPKARANASVARSMAIQRAKTQGLVLLKDKPGVGEAFKLTYASANAEKGGNWEREDTYGGKLTENADQAISRDLMAFSMLQVDADPVYDMVMSVHDEVVAEVDEGAADHKGFEALVTRLPPWAVGCPVTAEAWTGPRYKKA